MRFFLSLLLLAVLVAAAPYDDADKVIITVDDYPENLVIYESEYDIVDIVVPLNTAIDFDSSENVEEVMKRMFVFFIEAEIKDGRRVNKGVSVYKDGKVTKVMDSGTAVVETEQTFYVFIGAKDGLHVYDTTTGKTNKYGKFDYSIKGMAKDFNSDAIYILTEDRVLYKVYNAATVTEEVQDVQNAEQIIIDFSNNLYFYGDDKKPYVRNVDGEIKGFEGLPQGTEVRFFKLPVVNEDGVAFLVDNEMYSLYPNGQSEVANFAFMPDAVPTACSMEYVFLNYFGYNKKVYEFDFMSMVDFSERSSNKV